MKKLHYTLEVIASLATSEEKNPTLVEVFRQADGSVVVSIDVFSDSSTNLIAIPSDKVAAVEIAVEELATDVEKSMLELLKEAIEKVCGFSCVVDSQMGLPL